MAQILTRLGLLFSADVIWDALGKSDLYGHSWGTFIGITFPPFISTDYISLLNYFTQNTSL